MGLTPCTECYKSVRCPQAPSSTELKDCLKKNCIQVNDAPLAGYLKMPKGAIPAAEGGNNPHHSPEQQPGGRGGIYAQVMLSHSLLSYLSPPPNADRSCIFLIT